MYIYRERERETASQPTIFRPPHLKFQLYYKTIQNPNGGNERY